MKEEAPMSGVSALTEERAPLPLLPYGDRTEGFSGLQPRRPPQDPAMAAP